MAFVCCYKNCIDGIVQVWENQIKDVASIQKLDNISFVQLSPTTFIWNASKRYLKQFNLDFIDGQLMFYFTHMKKIIHLILELVIWKQNPTATYAERNV